MYVAVPREGRLHGYWVMTEQDHEDITRRFPSVFAGRGRDHRMRLLGALLILSVFVGLFAIMARVSGWRVAAAVWAITLVLTAALVAGAVLLAG